MKGSGSKNGSRSRTLKKGVTSQSPNLGLKTRRLVSKGLTAVGMVVLKPLSIL